MRIAYLTGEYPRATDTFIQREVTGLRKQGIEVHTFSVRRTGDEHMVGPEQELERQNTFYILPPNPLKLLIAHLLLLIGSPNQYLQALKLAWSTRQLGLKGTIYQLFYFLEAGILAHEIKQRQIQHLHNHLGTSSASVAMLAAALGGFTFSMTLHGPHLFFEPYRWRLDAKIQQALFVCCISHFCRSQAMLFAPFEKWNRLHIIHCGIEPSLFELTSHQSDRKRLLYVGRLAVEKGLPILLEALATLKSYHQDMLLIVVGDGSDRPKLESLTQNLGLSNNVKFVGYQSQGEVRNYLQQTDIFILPSFAEGLPVSLMEALAAGVPVVTTQIAGVSELVEDGVNGYLVPPGDSTLLAKRIDLLLKDPDQRRKLGTSGRAKVEQDFNIYSETERLSKVIHCALAGKVEAIRPN
ncbi:glycosyl transferase group 1 [Gloeothece citriformis PCC 7424]|uniref:Glycosyl transferase group 1 n=1 Tax=Gloeothece citriformis (strain PCC 7424) TaxID=65393 RepID=B7KIE7_GLOC7|nr:glycosyltransferase family 4 protein [Gloeothece citriformis]ACK73634.1 glycosyl transferase group 1 [Gloeothece citriformis PCC 7424]